MSNKQCQQCHNNFQMYPEDLEFYQRIKVPEPTLCPDCRQQRRLAFRNERKLYHRKCDLCKKSIISIYSADKPYTVYCLNCWWGNSWDATDYGQDFDFSRPFFEQYKELLERVPTLSLQNKNCENSEYGNDCDDLKNCYLLFNSEKCEDSYYCTILGFSKSCVDCFWCLNCELCYEGVKLDHCYSSFYCFNSNNLDSCILCHNCRNLKNCFGCINLSYKEYCIFNEQYTKKEYIKKIKNLKLDRKKIQIFFNKHPYRNLNTITSEDCIGDFLNHCKRCIDCYDMIESENCRYVWDGNMNDSYDCSNVGLKSTLGYEAAYCYRFTNINFSFKDSGGHDNKYNYLCYNSHDNFGCVSLEQNRYCILNKQYSEESFFKLKAKIIEHMKRTGEYGEFFPIAISPFAYNETLAQEYFPLTQKQVLKNGWQWKDDEKQIIDRNLPVCISCHKNFRIIPQELKFYQKQNISEPKKCSDCRHEERINIRNPRKIWNRKCVKCYKEIKTTYAPDRPEIIYCEECYNKEIY